MIIPLADAKARLSAVLDDVRDTHDRVVITRNGRPEAVIVSVADLETLEETLDLSLAPAARRVPVEGPPRGLPVAVAAAVTEFLTGALLDNPHRVGKPLARGLAGYHFARRGAYRVVYRIDEPARTVHVVRIDHRADVYRPH